MSCDGIQIFSLDLVLDLFIGRHLILFLPKNSSKTVMAILTASGVFGNLYVFLQACQQVWHDET